MEECEKCKELLERYIAAREKIAKLKQLLEDIETAVRIKRSK